MIIDNKNKWEQKLLRGEIILTKFLDLNEISELETNTLFKPYKITLFGGYEGAERRRAVISNRDIIVTNDDFEIVAYETSYNSKFNVISHRQVYGTIMSLGIERNTFGDIVVNDNVITIFMSKNMAEYIIDNLSYVAHQHLIWKKFEQFKEIQIEEKERVIIIPSMRLDALISKGINISRNDANEMINNGLVFINHRVEKNNSHVVKINDVISIRKYGRLLIKEVEGTTNSNRLRIKIGVKH